MHTSSETAQAKPYAKVSAWVLYVAITTTGKDRMDMLRGHEMWKMLEGEHVNESGVEYVVGVQNIFSGQLFKNNSQGKPEPIKDRNIFTQLRSWKKGANLRSKLKTEDSQDPTRWFVMKSVKDSEKTWTL